MVKKAKKEVGTPKTYKEALTFFNISTKKPTESTITESVKKAHKEKSPLKENKNVSNLEEELDIVNTTNSVLKATPTLEANLNEIYNQKLQEVEDKLKIKKNQVVQAVTVLKKLVDDKFKKNFDLLARKEDEFIHLNFVFNKLPIRYSIRPTPIELPYDIYGKKYNTRVCIIVKDPRSDLKDLKIEFPFATKIFDLEKLRLKYSRFNERRNLLKDFDLFLCDSRVYMILKRFLGKPFFANKKYPIPVQLDYSKPDEIKNDITNVVNKRVAFYMTHGPNYSIKAARVVMDTEEAVNNIINVAARTISHILKWGVDFQE